MSKQIIKINFEDGTSVFGTDEDMDPRPEGMYREVPGTDEDYLHVYPWHTIRKVYVRIPK